MIWNERAAIWRRRGRRHDRDDDRVSGGARCVFRPGLPRRISDHDDVAVRIVRDRDGVGPRGPRQTPASCCRARTAWRAACRTTFIICCPESSLFVIGEHFHRVEHCLLGVRGAAISDLKRAHSHTVALGQVRHSLRALGLLPVVQADTAGAAQLVAEWGRKEEAAVASALAAEIYGLDVLKANIEDAAHNTTRFYVMAPRPVTPDPSLAHLMTTFVFRVRNVPAALYKALGGFATNGVNMTKLESYMLAGHFAATQFLCDVDGHPEQPGLRRALEELSFFSSEVAGAGGLSGSSVPFVAGGVIGQRQLRLRSLLPGRDILVQSAGRAFSTIAPRCLPSPRRTGERFVAVAWGGHGYDANDLHSHAGLRRRIQKQPPCVATLRNRLSCDQSGARIPCSCGWEEPHLTGSTISSSPPPPSKYVSSRYCSL